MNVRYGCVTVGNDGRWSLVDCNEPSIIELLETALELESEGQDCLIIPSNEAVAIQHKELTGWDFSRCFMTFSIETDQHGKWLNVKEHLDRDAYPDVHDALDWIEGVERDLMQDAIERAELAAGWDRNP